MKSVIQAWIVAVGCMLATGAKLSAVLPPRQWAVSRLMPRVAGVCVGAVGVYGLCRLHQSNVQQRHMNCASAEKAAAVPAKQPVAWHMRELNKVDSDVVRQLIRASIE